MNGKLYLSKPQLKAELERCLKCPDQPCMKACPVKCNPQDFISQAKAGQFNQAVATINSQNPMGQTCGLICPDKFCMKACTRNRIDFSINIPKVQATLLENFRINDALVPAAKPNGYRIAIIGAGPAGLSAAAELSRNGFAVCIFEAEAKIGGALTMIPQERLPQSVIEKDAASILNNPLVKLQLNNQVNNPASLFNQNFNGVIVACGEQETIQLNIPGQEYALPYTEYLRFPEKYKTTGKVAVIGGGNVAADCAFTACKNGAAVVEMFVRRRLSDMRMSKYELWALIEQEINVNTLTSPIKIVSQNGILSLIVCKNQFIDGKLQPIANSEVKIDGFSLIITAIGSKAASYPEDERIIYAGDCKTGGSTLVEALASGREAAHQMIIKLTR